MSEGEGAPPWRTSVDALVVSSDRRILLVPSEEGWRLPRVDVEGYASDDLRNASRALEALLGSPVTILRHAGYSSDEARRLLEVVYVLEPLDAHATAPPVARRFGRDELADLAFAAAEQRQIAAMELDELELGVVPARRVPWACEGWLPGAEAWIAKSLTAQGRAPTGRIEQMRAWCLSCLLRVPTAQGTVFFKATADSPLLVEEGSVMRGLARLFPKNVPRPLAVDSLRRWMLLADLGAELGWSAPVEIREDVLRLFASMQVETCGRVDELLSFGCLDRRLDWLAREAKELVADHEALAALDEAEIARLRVLEPRLEDLCRQLAESGIPDTLVHGDLHMSNVARLDDEYVFFDWTDSAVTHPFLDLIDVVFTADDVVRDRLRDAYLAMWTDFAPANALLAAWKTAEPLISLNQAVSYRHIAANIEVGSGQDLDWCLPYFLRKALGAEALAD